MTVQGGVNSRSIPKLVEFTSEKGIPTFSQSGSEEVRFGFLVSEGMLALVTVEFGVRGVVFVELLRSFVGALVEFVDVLASRLPFENVLLDQVFFTGHTFLRRGIVPT